MPGNYHKYQPGYGHADQTKRPGYQENLKRQQEYAERSARGGKYHTGAGGARAYGEFNIGAADDQPWQDRMSQQIGFADETLARMESGELSQAQRQMQAGLGAAQRQSMAQAVGRGSNPLAQRAAAYGSAQAGQQAVTQSAMLRAAEEQAARQQYADTLKQQSQGTMGFTAMDMQRRMAQAQHHAQMQGLENQREQQDFENTMAVAGAVMQGAGGLMAMSDERAKQLEQKLSAAQADAELQRRARMSQELGALSQAEMDFANQMAPQIRASAPRPDYALGAMTAEERAFMDSMAPQHGQRWEPAPQPSARVGYLAPQMPDPGQSQWDAAGAQGVASWDALRDSYAAPVDIYEPELPGDQPGGGRQVYDMERSAEEKQAQQGFAGGIMGAGKTLSAYSDERAKQAAYLAGRRDQDAALQAVQQAALGAARQTPEYGIWRSQHAPPPTPRDEYTQLHRPTSMRMRRAVGGLGGAAERIGGGAHAQAELQRRRSMDEAIDRMPGLHTYEYKPGVAHAMNLPTDRRAGVMAQELERSGPVGRGMVLDTPQGKQIDVGAATSVNMALVGRLGERVEELESKLAAAAEGTVDAGTLGAWKSKGFKRKRRVGAAGRSFEGASGRDAGK